MDSAQSIINFLNIAHYTAKYPWEFHGKYGSTTAYLSIYVHVTDTFQVQVVNGACPTFSNRLSVYVHSTHPLYVHDTDAR